MTKKQNKKTAVQPESPKVNQKILTNGLTDLVTGLGLSRDFGTQLSQTATLMLNNRYYLLSNDRNTLTYMYLTHGIVQTMIDQPVEDAFRGGITIKSDELDEDELQDLQDYLNENKIIKEIKDLAKWSRLFGGGGMVIGIDGQEGNTLLDIDSINKDTVFQFYAADLWELFMTNTNTYSEEKPYLPEYENEIPYVYYTVPLHKTRVIKTNGKKAPSFLRPQLRGWGMSELERIVRDFNSYLKNQDLVFELLDEAKIDVYKIDSFNSSLLSPQGTSAITNRIGLSNQLKNFQQALVMDTKDDYQQKQLTFGGLPEMLAEIRRGIANATKIPEDKLFGQSAGGFGSGEDSLENYNSMIESEIRGEYDDVILVMLRLICKKLFDFVPDDLQISYKPLRILNTEQEENVKDKQFNRLLALYQSGIMTAEQIVNQVNLAAITPNKFELEVANDQPAPPESPQKIALPKGVSKGIANSLKFWK